MLKRLLIHCAVAIAAFVGFGSAAQAAICPTTFSTNTDCAFILTIAANGTITGSAVPGANPYDGSDDALVGVINNMSTAFIGSITLSGSGNGGGIFAFEGDGICVYTGDSYCSSAPTGYEGPINTFANINALGTMGDVVFGGNGLAAGATTFFSLESSPSSITGNGGITVGGGVPEPATWALMLVGFLSVGFAMRRRQTMQGTAASYA